MGYNGVESYSFTETGCLRKPLSPPRLCLKISPNPEVWRINHVYLQMEYASAMFYRVVYALAGVRIMGAARVAYSRAAAQCAAAGSPRV